ncbi:hypothetical protein AB6A40_000231 [Gnathostoma spinigerum]|uniref:Uncharacterized protein n=1 Tax=Gnathostoma spinigerum TaxID=75299 RepID=A0ABD6EAM1_9BILA
MLSSAIRSVALILSIAVICDTKRWSGEIYDYESSEERNRPQTSVDYHREPFMNDDMLLRTFFGRNSFPSRQSRHRLQNPNRDGRKSPDVRDLLKAADEGLRERDLRLVQIRYIIPEYVLLRLMERERLAHQITRLRQNNTKINDVDERDLDVKRTIANRPGKQRDEYDADPFQENEGKLSRQNRTVEQSVSTSVIPRASSQGPLSGSGRNDYYIFAQRTPQRKLYIPESDEVLKELERLDDALQGYHYPLNDMSGETDKGVRSQKSNSNELKPFRDRSSVETDELVRVKGHLKPSQYEYEEISGRPFNNNYHHETNVYDSRDGSVKYPFYEDGSPGKQRWYQMFGGDEE